MMTFAQFQATGRDVSDLSTVIADEAFNGMAARVYAGDAYMEPCDDGEFCLTIYNESWKGSRERMEAILYTWCLVESDNDDEFGISRECAYALATACNVTGLEKLADIICTPREQGEARNTIETETDVNECCIAGFAYVNNMLADDIAPEHHDAIDEVLGDFYEVIEQSEYATDDTRSNGPR